MTAHRAAWHVVARISQQPDILTRVEGHATHTNSGNVVVVVVLASHSEPGLLALEGDVAQTAAIDRSAH